MSENRTRGIQFGAPRTSEAPGGTGIEPPVPEWVDVSQTLERWFAFVDVCGFTSYTERYGTPAALAVLMADDGLQSLMSKAVEAAERRGRELAG